MLKRTFRWFTVHSQLSSSLRHAHATARSRGHCTAIAITVTNTIDSRAYFTTICCQEKWSGKYLTYRVAIHNTQRQATVFRTAVGFATHIFHHKETCSIHQRTCMLLLYKLWPQHSNKTKQTIIVSTCVWSI